MTNILLIDIDHTISDAAWRDDMISGQTDWDAYHLAGKEDKSIQEIVQFVYDLRNGPGKWQVICITARPNKWRQQTMQWMLANYVTADEILMRQDDNYRSAPEMKIELLKARFGNDLKELSGANVIFVDDNEKVIEAMRGLGITTLHITAAKRIRL